MEYISILLPALLAGALVVLTHAPLGIEVLRRGIVFIDLALAQAAAFGSIFVTWLIARYASQPHSHSHSHSHDHAPSQDYGVSALEYLSAYGAAIICSCLFYLVRKAPAKIQEALIGCVFVLAASASILLLSNHPQGGEHLKDVLVGQILWVQWSDLAVAAGVSVLVGIGLWFFRVRQMKFMFYPTFAIAVTLATQLVGVYLVFATLIIPALAAYKSKKPLFVAYTTGLSGYTLGLWLSVVIDSPSGSVIVITIAAAALMIWIMQISRGSTES